MNNPFRVLAVPFFASGFAALIYQVAWQRLLFVALGVDIESVTIIVSTFMLGLGIGALAGGRLSDKLPDRTLELFFTAEFLIGIFGLASPHLIGYVGTLTIDEPRIIIAGANFLLLLLPTTMMGATLPILVAYMVRSNGNVGLSIGGLYFINTLGASLGALSVGFLLFYYFDLYIVIYLAATINLLVSAFILASFKLRSL